MDKPSILHSFENLVRGMDPSAGQEQIPENAVQQQPKRPPKPRVVMEEGVFLGRTWRRYSDGSFEGETVGGMESFRDLDQFEAFVVSSPVLRTELAAAERMEASSDPEPEPSALVETETMPEPSVVSVLPPLAPAEPSPAPSAPAPPRSMRAQSESPRGPVAPVQLGRDLILAGALGLMACAAWWLRFHVLADVHGELARRGVGEAVIRSTNLSVLDRISCLFVNIGSCAAVKHWGRFAGYLVYEPGFLWIACSALIAGLWLRSVQAKRSGT